MVRTKLSYIQCLKLQLIRFVIDFEKRHEATDTAAHIENEHMIQRSLKDINNNNNNNFISIALLSYIQGASQSYEKHY